MGSNKAEAGTTPCGSALKRLLHAQPPNPNSAPTPPQNFTFNICGYSSFKCLPKWTEKFQYGAVVQAWDSAPPCNVTDNSTMCYSYVDQQFECCSASCEVVGVGTPLWSLINPNDPVNGGVQLKYSSVPPDADSPNPCGVDTDGCE